jgi:hypothetical protein
LKWTLHCTDVYQKVRFVASPLAKRQRPATEEEETYLE